MVLWNTPQIAEAEKYWSRSDVRPRINRIAGHSSSVGKVIEPVDSLLNIHIKAIPANAICRATLLALAVWS